MPRTGERASARSYERRRGRSYETSGVDLRRPPPCDVGTAVLLDTRSFETPRPPAASSGAQRPRAVPALNGLHIVIDEYHATTSASLLDLVSALTCGRARFAGSRLTCAHSLVVRSRARSFRRTRLPCAPCRARPHALVVPHTHPRCHTPARSQAALSGFGFEAPAVQPSARHAMGLSTHCDPPPHCVVDFGSRASSRLFSQLRKSALAVWTIVLASRAQGGIPSREASASAAPPGCECAGGRRSGRRGGRC